MSDPTRATFTTRARDTLTVATAHGAELPLRVDRVEDYDDAGLRFSVFLAGPADQALAQGTHAAHIGDGESFALFLVPVERAGDELVYEAAFNRVAGHGGATSSPG